MISKALLFHLPIYGEGTSDIESLPSYLSRLAFEHHVSPIDMVNYLLGVGQAQSVFDVDLKSKKLVSILTLISAGDLPKRIEKAVQAITGVNLLGSNFSFTNLRIRLTKRETVNHFKWCPCCFAEMRKRGISPYFKLIWLIVSVSSCSIHNCKLESKCASCGAEQKMTRRKKDHSWCTKCGADLAELHTQKTRPESWVHSGQDIVELLNDLFRYGQQGMSVDGFNQSCRDLFDPHNDLLNDSYFSPLKQRELNEINRTHASISLLKIRRMAFTYGFPLYSIITGQVRTCSTFISPSIYKDAYPRHLQSFDKQHHDHRTIFLKAVKLIYSCQKPMPLKQLARQLAVSVGYLEYRYPEFCYGVKECHRLFLERRKEEQNIEAKTVALEYFKNKNVLAADKNKQKAYIYLKSKYGLPKALLVKAIDEAYEAVSS